MVTDPPPVYISVTGGQLYPPREREKPGDSGEGPQL